MTPGRWRIIAYAVALALLAVGVAWFSHDGPSMENPAFDALARAHQHRDSVRTPAAEARKENVVARRAYTESRASLPPAIVKILAESATIHITTETFTVPRPVAEYVLGLQQSLALADSALAASDTALAKTLVEVAAADSVSTAADTVIAVLQEKPGFLARAWRVVETPVKVLGGFTLGVLAARAVR